MGRTATGAPTDVLTEIAEPDRTLAAPNGLAAPEALAAANGRRRALTTSVPEVTCAICERRLLRGERPESFLTGTRTELVCELCSDRAHQAGWVRARDLSSAPRETYAPRTRRRTLLGRLRRKRSDEQSRANRSTRGVS